jgi:drug/metabolite transporter (DMT)-like permease
MAVIMVVVSSHFPREVPESSHLAAFTRAIQHQLPVQTGGRPRRLAMTRLRAFIGRVPPNLQGMALMLAVTIFIVSMHGMIRYLSRELHPFEVAFFRNLFGIPILLPFLIRDGFKIFRTPRLRVHIIRSVGHVIAMLTFCYGLSTTELATANALGFTAPLFAAALATIVLGEVFRWRRWTALTVGFIGMLVILRPGIVPLDTGPMFILFSSCVWGTVLVIIKSLGQRESVVTIVAWMIAFMIPLSLVPALFVWQWPSWEQLGLMAIMGMMGTAGHFMITSALKIADTAAVMPIDFLKLVWAALIGYALFGEIPDFWTFVGGAIVFAAATYIALRERRAVPTPAPMPAKSAAAD